MHFKRIPANRSYGLPVLPTGLVKTLILYSPIPCLYYHTYTISLQPKISKQNPKSNLIPNTLSPRANKRNTNYIKRNSAPVS